MKYFYDTEFIDTGKTITLISIGIVCEDGREYYAESSDFNESDCDAWLHKNVLSQLHLPRKPNSEIAQEISLFISPSDEDVELWAFYSAYDHVVLSQLYGKMLNTPRQFPMFSMDIRQLETLIGREATRQTKGLHNALEDARWNFKAWKELNA